MMTDAEFDDWQLDVRKQLQDQVRVAYEIARQFPSLRTQGQAYGISLYERMTRDPFDDSLNILMEVETIYDRQGMGPLAREAKR